MRATDIPSTPEQRKVKCQTKYHHAAIETARALKRALTFDLQKLTKRLKSARSENTDVKTIQRLADELEAAKSLQLDGMASYYLESVIYRNHKELSAVLELQSHGKAPHSEAPESTKNVVARLFGSKTFREAVMLCIGRMEEILGLKKRLAAQKVAKKMPDPQGLAVVGESDMNTELAQKSLAVQSENEISNSDHSDIDMQRGDDSSYQAQPDPSMRASTFLPSLQSGYLPALDGSDDEGELKGLFPAQKKERKNRRGQRARRKILEAKHGNKANHIIQEREAAQKDYEERVARRAAKEAERTGANSIAIEEAERNRKERREALLRPIHGSWAIAKAQKVKMLQAKPQGTKISFD